MPADKHPLTVLLMGPPGAGKGTQATYIVDVFGLRHVATGDVLRDAVKEGTGLGLKAQKYMDAGQLVPDDVIIGLLRDLIANFDSSEGLLLDGFPRTLPQAEALDGALAELSRKVDVAIDIVVPRERLIERLSGRWICRNCQRPYNSRTSPPEKQGVCDHCGGELYQRSDDTAEAVRKRLDVYSEQTTPVVAYYRDAGVLAPIDGNLDRTAVQASIAAAIQSRTAGR